MAKLTFSLDDATIEMLRRTAERTRKPQSWVVREAIAHYAAREERLAPEERDRLLGVLRRIGRRAPGRSAGDVDRELQDIRQSRRTGWSRKAR